MSFDQRINSSDKSTLQKVIDGGYCIGCGACAVRHPVIKMQVADGLIQAEIPSDTNFSGLDGEICPFGTTLNEDMLAADRFGKIDGIRWERRVGYHLKLYAGAVTNGADHWNSSSGGVTTWLLKALLKAGEIDAVIHVGPTGGKSPLFEYGISNSLEEITARAKSRYYPTHFADVFSVIHANPDKRYAFVGVPCFVKAARLLCESDPRIKHSLKFFFAIFCGHMKSASFAELLAWQQGVAPEELEFINFREKNKDRSASQYSIKVAGGNKRPQPTLNKALYGTDWGLGYFKPKACDWCDDVSGETADLVCGDAWLPEHEADSRGTNIIIVRNPALLKILERAEAAGEINLSQLPLEKIIQSQAGNYRHRHEGLSLRIKQAKNSGTWAPTKRIKPGEFHVSAERRKIYDQRVKLAAMSHHAFQDAKKRGSLLYFLLKMAPHELRYYFLNRRFLKGLARMILTLPRILR